MQRFFTESGEGVKLCTWRETGLNRDKHQHSWKQMGEKVSADIYGTCVTWVIWKREYHQLHFKLYHWGRTTTEVTPWLLRGRYRAGTEPTRLLPRWSWENALKVQHVGFWENVPLELRYIRWHSWNMRADQSHVVLEVSSWISKSASFCIFWGSAKDSVLNQSLF